VSLACKDCGEGARVVRGVPARKCRSGHARHTEVLGSKDQFANLPVGTELRYQRRRARTDLVESVLAAHDPRAFGSKTAERSSHEGAEGIVIDADELVRGTSGIRKRSKGIENRAGAELSPGLANVFETGVVRLGKQKCDAGFA
jgi:hypothetical protein